MGVLSHLEPKPVFDYFEKLCAVPHGSGNTKLISDLCASFARELGLKYRQEDCNNLIIWKDASAGYENAAPVILQGHMDMVCAQTEDCTKDMSREGLDLRTDGTYVWADKTSLGGESCFSVSLSGLQGGHSGAEIDKGRGNAVQLMGRALYGAMEQVGALRIADLRGGQFDNVICPRCDAVVAVPAGKEEEFTSFVRKFDRIMKNELSVADGGVTLSCAAVSGTAAYDADASARMLHALLVMPQGVQVMSPDFPGLVQTSQNLGVITAEDDGLRFSLSIRSSVTSEKEMLLQKVRAIVTFAGGTVSTRGDYPAWQYARQSPLRDTVMAAYKRVTGKDGVALAIHAGLECGLLAGKMPGLDAVSFGPELLDIHSPRERLGVASVERMYQLVCEILKNCR